MGYGTGALAERALETGAEFGIKPTAGYLISLVYLAVLGSVLAFVVYFSIVRTKGYALASYISALTPRIAMLASAVFENARFGIGALIGVMIVVSGQALMIRAARRVQ